MTTLIRAALVLALVAAAFLVNQRANRHHRRSVDELFQDRLPSPFECRPAPAAARPEFVPVSVRSVTAEHDRIPASDPDIALQTAIFWSLVTQEAHERPRPPYKPDGVW